MRRRTVLREAAAAGALGTALASGCLTGSGDGGADSGGDGDPEGNDGSDGNASGDGGAGDVRWRHDVGGTVHAVAAGRVFGLEDPNDGGDGGVFALDAETGERGWTFGESRGYHGYTPLAVDDALYFGFGDDAIGSGSGEVYALEFDGDLRWRRETGSVYFRPVTGDGVVYAGSDDGVVRAFDREDGSVRASAADLGSNPSVLAAADLVYVATRRLLALDPDDLTVRWRYGDADDRVRDVTVVDGTAYVSSHDGVAAVAGGERLWDVRSDAAGRVLAVASGRAFVGGTDGVRAFDADGTERWALEEPLLGVSGDVAYVGDGRVRAIDAADGTERWRADVDGRIERSTVVEVGGERALVVRIGDDALARIDPDGEVARQVTVDGGIRNYAVADGTAFVGSSAGISAVSID